MVGCLQAIRHGTSSVTQRRDWISSQGGFVVSCLGGVGVSVGIERHFSGILRDTFQSFRNCHELNIFLSGGKKSITYGNSLLIAITCACMCVDGRLSYMCLFLCMEIYTTCIHVSKLWV